MYVLNPALHYTQFPTDSFLMYLPAICQHPRSTLAAPKVPRHVNEGKIYPPNAKMAKMLAKRSSNRSHFL